MDVNITVTLHTVGLTDTLIYPQTIRHHDLYHSVLLWTQTQKLHICIYQFCIFVVALNLFVVDSSLFVIILHPFLVLISKTCDCETAVFEN